MRPHVFRASQERSRLTESVYRCSPFHFARCINNSVILVDSTFSLTSANSRRRGIVWCLCVLCKCQMLNNTLQYLKLFVTFSVSRVSITTPPPPQTTLPIYFINPDICNCIVAYSAKSGAKLCLITPWSRKTVENWINALCGFTWSLRVLWVLKSSLRWFGQFI